MAAGDVELSQRHVKELAAGKGVIVAMTEEEAIEQMELLGHDFFVFFNAELGRLNVLYRRVDDQYGVLDPEIA